jgi:hypothetical protein
MTSKARTAGAAAFFALAITIVGAMLGLPSHAGSDTDARIPFPPPASHQGRWIEYHGKSVGAAGNSPGSPGAACLICHERTDCIGCHATTLPKDHTNHWRTRGHGLMVAGNRERCMTCHRQDFCIRCHSETAPRSHTAGWRSRHCTFCHFGSGSSISGNCTVCHKQRQHVAAPHPVTPGLDCTLCHH